MLPAPPRGVRSAVASRRPLKPTSPSDPRSLRLVGTRSKSLLGSFRRPAQPSRLGAPTSLSGSPARLGGRAVHESSTLIGGSVNPLDASRSEQPERPGCLSPMDQGWRPGGRALPSARALGADTGKRGSPRWPSRRSDLGCCSAWTPRQGPLGRAEARQSETSRPPLTDGRRETALRGVTGTGGARPHACNRSSCGHPQRPGRLG